MSNKREGSSSAIAEHSSSLPLMGEEEREVDLESGHMTPESVKR